MYESFFQLSERPFAAAPRADRYFPAPSIEGARQTLARCIERAEGAGMLVGPSGSGKTLVCQVLAEQFRDRFAVAFLTNGHLSTRRALLQAILFELGLPYRGMEEGELRLALIDHLSGQRDGPQGMLLLVDEAHTFSVRLLEEVRLITNLVRHGQPRVRLVLAGSPLLEERFASPLLDSFSQRIASRCYLESLDRAQTQHYVAAQLGAVGGDASRVFTPDALEAVYRATDGIPRLINQVCDHALMLAFAGGRRQLSGTGIQEAWADLQQLPAPWSESVRPSVEPPTGQESFIEFGRLDDELPEPQPEPTVLLHQIDEHLASLEDDFQPVATIGPDPGQAKPAIKAASSPFKDPFREPFDEEEVVLDRYAAFESAGPGFGSFSRHPRVVSQEGQMLSDMLEPCAEQPPRLTLVEPAASDESDALGQVSHDSSGQSRWHLLSQTYDTSSISEGRVQGPEAKVPEARMQEERTQQERTIPESKAPGACKAAGPDDVQAKCSTRPESAAHRDEEQPDAQRIGVKATPGCACSNEEVADSTADSTADEDQIIVEDDPHQGLQAGSPPPPAGARRHEYRQLFSMLRRG